MRGFAVRVRFWRNQAGAAMLEFAIILPILLLMFLALVEFTDAFSVRRKVEATAASVADLVAQSGSVTPAELNDIMSIGTALMRPYSAAPLGIRVSSVVLDEDTKEPTVVWSHGNGKYAAHAADSQFENMPAGLMDDTHGMIVAETTYVFRPVVGTYLLAGRTFTSTAYFRPRIRPAVELLR
jgi:Flp pilus assembly protein TadG